MALVATSDLITSIPFTINPFKIAYGTMRFSFNAMKFGTELALSVITNEKEKVGSALEKWNLFCLQYGIPRSPFGVARGVYTMNKALVAVGVDMGLLMFDNLLSKKRNDFAGELVLIVGSNRPLGANLAFKLAASKAKVICIGNTPAENEQVSKIIRDKLGFAAYYNCDITDEDAIAKVLEAIKTDIGGEITMYFNCYGVPDDTTDMISARDIIDRSITANFFILDRLIPRMKENGKGQIVLMKSVDSMMRTTTERSAMIVSQYGIEGLYASAFDKLREMKAEKQVKASFVRVYPKVVIPKEAREIATRKRQSSGIFGDIDAASAAEFIVEGLKKGYDVFSTPYSAGIYETMVGALPMNVGLKLQRMLYNQ
jgi:short-subunit dehydrogenase